MAFRWLCLFLLLAGALTLPAQAQNPPPGDIGIGGQLGDPSGITLRLYQRPGFAYDFLAAWDLDDFFFLNAHLLYEFRLSDTSMNYFAGPGGFVGFREDPLDDSVLGGDGNEVAAGISGNFGINFFVERIEIFLQLTPRLLVIPETEGDFGGGVGLRYYF